MYAYCNGNPINASDRLGLCSDYNGWGGFLAGARDMISSGWHDQRELIFDVWTGYGEAGGYVAATTVTAGDYITNGINGILNFGSGTGAFAGDPSLENLGGVGEDMSTAAGAGLALATAAPIGQTGKLVGTQPAPNNCFVAGTLVQMADGKTKPIEQVKQGDVVKSRDPQTGKDEAKRVVRTFVNEAQGTLITLRFADGNAVTTTVGHPFYVEGKGFVLAGDLGIGTSIVTRAGTNTASTLVSAVRHPGETATIYNFEVEDTHTYFVGDREGGLWVNNSSQPGTYALFDEETGQIMRTGRTNNLARRATEHARDLALKDFEFMIDMEIPNNYAGLRGREQILHETTNAPLNKIGGISPRNPLRPIYMKAGNALGKGKIGF